jgi:hypothetical protein
MCYSFELGINYTNQIEKKNTTSSSEITKISIFYLEKLISCGTGSKFVKFLFLCFFFVFLKVEARSNT